MRDKSLAYQIEEVKNNSVLIGCLCAIGSEIIYGLSYMFTKDVTEKFSMFALLGWRFLAGFITLNILVLLGIVKIDLKTKSVKPLFLAALFSPCIYYMAETLGIHFTTSSESGVLLSSISIASLIASTILLKKKPTSMQLTGILITLMGTVITVFAVSVSARFSLIGYGFLFIAIIAYSLYSVFVAKSTAYSGIEITYIMLLAGTIAFVWIACIEAILKGNIITLITLPLYDFSFLIAILYQGIGCSVFAFFMANTAISKIGVNRTSSFYGISTIVSIFAGAFVLHEYFSVGQLIGAVIIILGVYTANRKLHTV